MGCIHSINYGGELYNVFEKGKLVFGIKDVLFSNAIDKFCKTRYYTMPNIKTLKMEDMSEAYLRALCAANGYSIVKVEHDNDGLDIAVRCKGKAADDSILVSTEVEIQ